MQDGIQLEQGTLIEVLQNKLAQAAVKEAQLEAAVQQLINEGRSMSDKIMDLETQREKERAREEEATDSAYPIGGGAIDASTG
ncbi:MAG: hypothetical protein DRH08_01275 [Deltaproteobacteria bacterium]|nr:MAG: hypothetical protein DRH08_01275 [Deltaproteobacteria bacterium]